MSTIFFSLFFIVSLLHLFFCYVENDRFRCITKVFLMPLLLIFISSISKTPNPYIYLALIFGFIGDIFLIFDKNKTLFLFGLIAFLIGHLFYILKFYTLINVSPFKLAYLPILIFIIIFAFLMFNCLKPNLDNLKIPVVIYIFFICLMLGLAILNNFNSRHYLSLIALVGALLFTISDSLLSISLFKKAFKHYNFYIMLTYILGQLLLSFGLS
ncbi:MAG: lysoplasmalogenase [Clostridium sp.]|uniref:lysoplasmalogenase n=1 Tax=Clostridium sp. TaxID=1506 RepID=UPI003EE46EF8